MEDYPKGGLIGKTLRIIRRIQRMRIPVHAANAGYFIVLSIFPILVLVLSLLRYTPLDARDLMQFLRGILPEALMGAAEKLIISTYGHTSRTMVSISAVSALWSASRGIYGLLTGLNAIYGVREDRGYFYTRSISVFYTFAFLIMLIVTLTAYLFGEALLEVMPENGFLLSFLNEVLPLRFFLLLILQTALFAVMFMVLPNKSNTFRESLPGALLASGGWLTFSNLFSWYVERFAGYSGIYGSVYAVALSMLWLYWCLSIVFYGGALNQLLCEMKNK